MEAKPNKELTDWILDPPDCMADHMADNCRIPKVIIGEAVIRICPKGEKWNFHPSTFARKLEDGETVGELPIHIVNDRSAGDSDGDGEHETTPKRLFLNLK